MEVLPGGLVKEQGEEDRKREEATKIGDKLSLLEGGFSQTPRELPRV